MFRAIDGALRRLAYISALIFALFSITAATRAGVDPNSGIDFVTVRAPGNPAIVLPGTNMTGRGSVPYEYRIGKYEVTNAQWVEFVNAAMDRPASDQIPFFTRPNIGAQFIAPLNPGGTRFRVVPGGENMPVGGVTWHTAAIYANWLCNGKSTARSAFLSGAYDVSTFDTLGNDQPAHTPGAQYWIPTWDEWLKAAHFDPNKNGPNQPGWWQYSTRQVALTSRATDLWLCKGQCFSQAGRGDINAKCTVQFCPCRVIGVKAGPEGGEAARLG